VLLYAAPYSPFSQPRNLIGGHVIAVAVGVTCQSLLPSSMFEVAVPLAVALTVMVQMGVDMVHPPGGGAAAISVLGAERVTRLGWRFVAPVFVSVALMLAVALAGNVFVCFTAKRKYPSGGLRKLYRW
jgi:CBS domain-containing membrane protein